MNILFVHQSFPAQFKFLAPALVLQGHQVAAFTHNPTPAEHWQGVRLFTYSIDASKVNHAHPLLRELESRVIRAEAVMQAAIRLRKTGYAPDVIIIHPGWGEGLFLQEVWPRAKVGVYCEFFYRPEGLSFDSEFHLDSVYARAQLRTRNLSILSHLASATRAISPTYWQASTFPHFHQSKISVIHDGVNTKISAPNDAAAFALSSGRVLTRLDKVVTFVNRNFEPHRGYHTFMRALPGLLQEDPEVEVVLVGGEQQGYGAPPESGRTWKQVFIDEVREQISPAHWRRVHFTGRIPYEDLVALFQVSTVHVYLSYPFITSWSLVEAMSTGCAIVGSATAPVQEMITDRKTGILVDFFDPVALANTIAALLREPEQRVFLGSAAREFARTHFDYKTVTLPRQLAWVHALAQA